MVKKKYNLTYTLKKIIVKKAYLKIKVDYTIKMNYELDLKKVIEEIKKNKAKKICIQLPDGLKQYANQISDKIQKETKTNPYIWLGSCFGACDLPLQVKNIGVDMLIQWGHSQWN